MNTLRSSKRWAHWRFVSLFAGDLSGHEADDARIQIMDAKMDSGYLGPGENHAQALEDDYDVMQELAPEQVVGIMDELLCHEVGTGSYSA